MEEKKIDLLEGRERFEKPIFTSQDEAINKVPSKVDELEPTFNEEKNCVVDQSVSFLQLFRFASQFDMILIVTSVICAAASGVSFLMSIIYYGDILNSFITKDFTDEEINTMRCNGTNATVWPVNSTEMVHISNRNETLFEAVKIYAVNSGIVFSINMLLAFIYVTCLNIAAENQIYRLRYEFMKSLLKQDIAWHDAKNSNDYTEDLIKIEEAIGEKIGIAVSYLSIVTVCVIVSFAYGWELTLVAIISMQIDAVSVAVLGRIQAHLTFKESQLYASLSGMAEEILSAIQTVMMFGGQLKESRRYRDALHPAKTIAIKRGLIIAIENGMSWFSCYISYAVCFWFGIRQILDNCTNHNSYNGKSLNVIFYCIFYATLKIAEVLPILEIFSRARGAAISIFQVIDRVPPIDSSSAAGIIPHEAEGNIRFHQVHFHYPTRPNVKILNGISFQVRAGQTMALVGKSGCGKSTCIQLLQRFYDPCKGVVELDGHPVSDYNIEWLRAQFGVVSQEPVLFAATIADNIRYGHRDVSDLDIQRAAMAANAHHFISQLPLKYETMVGERGTQLSGGQKQRIAIARALVGNPKILLLDEATSSLDSESECVVQKALDHARAGRTSIIVAHRLTTIKNADMIVVLDDGVVKEVGDHETLIGKCGLYYDLIVSQKQEDNEKVERNTSKLTGPGIAFDRENPTSFGEDGSVQEETEVEYLNHVGLQITKENSPADTNTTRTSLWDIFHYMQPEWYYLALGVFGSFLMGLSTPVYAIVFGRTIKILGELDIDVVHVQKDVCALIFVLLGIATGIGAFLQTYMLTVTSVRLASRLRALSFESILIQKYAFFDRQENSVGSLCTHLSSDSSSIQDTTGVKIGFLVQMAVSLMASLVVAIYFNWKLALVLSVSIPLVIGSGIISVKISDGQNVEKYKSLAKAGAIKIESVSNIRTVTSLGLQETFHELYMNHLRESHLETKRYSPIRGAIFGVAINMADLFAIVGFYYGGYLIVNEGIHFQIVTIIVECLVYGMDYVGNTLAFMPNYGKAKVAADRIFKMINRTPESVLSSGVPNLDVISGKVQMDSVHFAYPTRKDIQILRDFSLKANPGETIAIVGQSGCGKSTCIQLLQRFYDADSGTISVDDRDVKHSDVSSHRSHLGIVSQEVMLFNRTIGENIAYGDLTRSISLEEIITASKKANIHEFIVSLPLGYDTIVGGKGSRLSGGQKQRVGIARALVRHPKILLLDEATSALDSQSEKMVQAALDSVSHGLTCIIVAHRLQTIQNADHIVVLHHGQVQEQGKHEELLRLKGIYHCLWTVHNGQNLALRD